MQLDVSAALGAGASAVVIFGGLGAGYVGLRRWVQRAAAPAAAAAAQLQTSNGTTVAGYVEQLVKSVAEVRQEQAAQSAATAAASERAAAAETLARHAHQRLDDHLIGHPKE
jgi:hypothetical protein